MVRLNCADDLVLLEAVQMYSDFRFMVFEKLENGVKNGVTQSL